VLFSQPLPTRAPTTVNPNYPNPYFPLPVQSGQTVSDYNPNIKPEYVESWTIGFQRELDRDTVLTFATSAITEWACGAASI